ncbi:hypothetical protein B0H10DRAFT_474267 [Mycena sp. CBHHK59/15]|nr:hypothetical protein B0H10DRAFT_474267 [Mycena sp. CBHHK59/15]
MVELAPHSYLTLPLPSSQPICDDSSTQQQFRPAPLKSPPISWRTCVSSGFWNAALGAVCYGSNEYVGAIPPTALQIARPPSATTEDTDPQNARYMHAKSFCTLAEPIAADGAGSLHPLHSLVRVACPHPFFIHPISFPRDFSIFNTYGRHRSARRRLVGKTKSAAARQSPLIHTTMLVRDVVVFSRMRICMGRAQCPAYPASTHSIPADESQILVAAADLLAET